MDDETKIKQLQQKWMDAWRIKDKQTLERILSDKFVLILSSDPSKPVRRSEWMELALGSYNCESFCYEIMNVRIKDDFAVVSSIYTQRASVNEVDRSGTFFLTDIWERGSAGWQVIERHSSRPEPKSDSTRHLVK